MLSIAHKELLTQNTNNGPQWSHGFARSGCLRSATPCCHRTSAKEWRLRILSSFIDTHKSCHPRPLIFNSVLSTDNTRLLNISFSTRYGGGIIWNKKRCFFFVSVTQNGISSVFSYLYPVDRALVQQQLYGQLPLFYRHLKKLAFMLYITKT